MTLRRRILIIISFLIVTAVLIALCINFITEGKAVDYEGTLVWANNTISCI